MWTPEAHDEQAATGRALALSDGRSTGKATPLTPYRVAPLPGVARGYVIEEFRPAADIPLEPDFHAMRVGRDSAPRKIGLLDDGEPVAASERAFRTVDMPPEAVLFLPALLPLAIGVAIRLARRR